MAQKITWGFLNLFFKPFVSRTKSQIAYKRILVMRYGFLGDVLQTTPILKSLGKAWPEAKVDYWVSTAGAPALSNNPNISSIINADRHGPLRINRPFAILRHASMLRTKRYDLAICLGPDPLYGFLAWLGGIERRVGLIVNKDKAVFLDSWIEVPLADRVSRQQRYLELLHQLGISISGEDEKIEISWSAEDERRVEGLLGEETSKPIALFCGTGPARFRAWANRRWMIDSWVDLAQKLIQHYPRAKILLIGTGQEAEANKKIASSLPERRVIDLSGETTFPQLGPVLKRCNLLISNDSAPVFVAAAVGCPSIVIYGPEWPERAKPLGAKTWHPVFVDIGCRDYCASFPDKAPQCKNECMSLITADMVLENIDQALHTWEKEPMV
jgi:heptosyltransferase-2